MSNAKEVRKDEFLAALLIRQWARGTGCLSLLGSGDNADCEISYPTGRRGLVEVKRDKDPREAALWSTMRKLLKYGQGLALAPGMGTWSARIEWRADIRHLRDELPAVIAEVASRGAGFWDPNYEWPSSPLAAQSRSLGIVNVRESGVAGEDICILLPSGIGGFVPPDAERAVPWVQEFLDTRSVRGAWRRFDVTDEGHAFIWMGSATPEDLLIRVSFHPDLPPSQPVRRPRGVTHIWIGVAAFDAWLFDESDRWSHVSLPVELRSNLPERPITGPLAPWAQDIPASPFLALS